MLCLFQKSFQTFKSVRFFVTKVPEFPIETVNLEKLPEETRIDQETIEQLEKVSLVKFGNEDGIRIVEEAIRFADKLTLVDTEGVEPLISVLEDRSLSLRDDKVIEGNSRSEILANAKKTEEGYFVAPPGNIPLETKDYKIEKKQLQDVLKFFIDNGFFKFNVVSKRVQRMTCGPMGELLSENIRKEWILTNHTYREHNVFPYHCRSSNDFLNDTKDAYMIGKELNGNSLPFGLVDFRKVHDASPSNQNNNEIFLPQHSIDMRYLGFFPPDEGKQFFYRWTQHRKRWWRKFSCDPGRFSLSEIKKDNDVEEASILATFPWGVHEVETVKFLGESPFTNKGTQANLKILCGEEKIFPHVIESICNLDYATVIYSCDSIHKTKDVCRFHRKLAPYKFAFAAPILEEKLRIDLFEMSQMLCFDIMKGGLSCLLPATNVFGRENLEKQLNKHKSIGIPYTAVLNEETLKSGIFGLYSRETTLTEEIHIEKFQDYGALLMKNY